MVINDERRKRMNSLRLEFERKKRGLSREDMAQLIKVSINSYGKKERGCVKFSDAEKIVIANKLQLTLVEVNDIFFDGKFLA